MNTTLAEVVDSTRLRYIDADGHILEHPTAMLDYAQAAYKDRIWHIEADADGVEWLYFADDKRPANNLSISALAGMTGEDREAAMRGELQYTKIRPAGYNSRGRVEDMTSDGIDQSVLYPTSLLSLAGVRDAEFAAAQCQAYNDWLSDHVGEVPGKLFGVAIVPQQDIDLAAAEIRRVAGKPGIVGIMMRPNPTADWKHLNHEVYEPIWRAASDAGLPIGFHPQLKGNIPGTCAGLRLTEVGGSTIRPGGTTGTDNLLFAQAISNPFDMMYAVTFMTMGGVCERFPDLKFAFLEANGGWIVTWLERLDHHVEHFSWDAPYLKQKPSEYFRRQCWISFDPDETALAFTANSPLVGADRIVWASDYPHPDAKFPGVTRELDEATEGLSLDQRRAIAGDACRALYGI